MKDVYIYTVLNEHIDDYQDGCDFLDSNMGFFDNDSLWKWIELRVIDSDLSLMKSVIWFSFTNEKYTFAWTHQKEMAFE